MSFAVSSLSSQKLFYQPAQIDASHGADYTTKDNLLLTAIEPSWYCSHWQLWLSTGLLNLQLVSQQQTLLKLIVQFMRNVVQDMYRICVIENIDHQLVEEQEATVQSESWWEGTKLWWYHNESKSKVLQLSTIATTVVSIIFATVFWYFLYV